MNAPETATPRRAFDVAIVGGGASGTLAAIHLLRAKAARPLRIALFEPTGRPGRGVAYGTTDPVHLLNVPAGRMSAYRDAPGHFLDWLRGRDGPWDADAFVPRRLYAEYLEHSLREAQRAAAPARLELCASEIVRIESDRARWTLAGRGGSRASAGAVVLALGHGAPLDLPVPDGGLYRSERYHRGPWHMRGVASNRHPVLLLGTGLTMVDAVLTLVATGFAGSMVATSRRGLLPRPHAVETAAFDGWTREPPSGGLRELLRRFRLEIAAARASGRDWRAVVDGLRPLTARVWQQLSLEDRRRFVRHLRPYWDSHRHRIAPAAARTLEACLASGQLRVVAGRVLAFRSGADSVEAIFRERGRAESTPIRVGAVINCTSPGPRVGAGAPAVMRRLIAAGIARADELGLGFDVDDEGRVASADGRANETLYALGPLRRGVLWESTAIPEIRAQAQEVARRIATAVANACDPAPGLA